MRLQFPNGCVANLTASRVSTDRVRKAAPLPAAPVPFARLRPPGSLLVRCNSRPPRSSNALVVEANGAFAVGTGIVFPARETRSAPRVTGPSLPRIGGCSAYHRRHRGTCRDCRANTRVRWKGIDGPPRSIPHGRAGKELNLYPQYQTRENKVRAWWARGGFRGIAPRGCGPGRLYSAGGSPRTRHQPHRSRFQESRQADCSAEPTDPEGAQPRQGRQGVQLAVAHAAAAGLHPAFCCAGGAAFPRIRAVDRAPKFDSGQSSLAVWDRPLGSAAPASADPT